jgi:DNA polymerase type B, organellar and viral
MGTKKAKDRSQIIAWDGEGISMFRAWKDGTLERIHVYNLLSNSQGTFVHMDQGIPTTMCLDFLLDVHQKNQRAVHVIFGGSYDVNMMLGDVPKSYIQKLWTEGRMKWKGYKINFRPRKMFSVTKWNREKAKYDEPAMVLWDVFGYFQCSFVEALRAWVVDAQGLDWIHEMKLGRADFSAEKFDEILKYNMMECLGLVALVSHLFRALETAQIEVMRFDGAGSIASALMRQNGVKKYISKPPLEIIRAAQVAYAGGRIEAVRVGNREDEWVGQYDKNSAYPSACLMLPGLQNARWVKSRYVDPKAVASLVRIGFHWKEALMYPLYIRTLMGEIYFPQFGEGIYWSPEYEMVQELFPGQFEVEWAYNAYVDDVVEYPLQWVREVYQRRLYFQQQANKAELAIKLGMNSIYGKFAQQAGYIAPVAGARAPRYPTYHDLCWAGMITSYNRAALFRLAWQNPDAVISFATDAVFTTDELDCVQSKQLGDWGLKEYEGMTIVQAGVYWLKKEGQWYAKYRGFDRDAISRDLVLDAWRNGVKKLPVYVTRFVGMGAALSRTEYDDVWRRWITSKRDLDVEPQGKRVGIMIPEYAEKLCYTAPAYNWMEDNLSERYPIIWLDGRRGTREEENMEDKELEDSFL